MPSQRFAPLRYLLLSTSVICFVVIVLDRVATFPWLRLTTTYLYAWTIVLAAFALLLGVFQVAVIHIRRIYTGHADWVNSLGLVAMLCAVLVAGMLDPLGSLSPTVEWIFAHMIAPGQATLFALLAFFMAAAAYRYLRIGLPGGSWMVVGALLMLVVQLPISQLLLPSSLLVVLRWWFTQPIMAAMRGALIGSSLALLVVGLRFLLGRNQA
jgi:hypothetical protein